MSFDRDRWIEDHPQSRWADAEYPTPEKEAAVLDVLRAQPGRRLTAGAIRQKVHKRPDRPWIAHGVWLLDFLRGYPDVEVSSHRRKITFGPRTGEEIEVFDGATALDPEYEDGAGRSE